MIFFKFENFRYEMEVKLKKKIPFWNVIMLRTAHFNHVSNEQRM